MANSMLEYHGAETPEVYLFWFLKMNLIFSSRQYKFSIYKTYCLQRIIIKIKITIKYYTYPIAQLKHKL